MSVDDSRSTDDRREWSRGWSFAPATDAVTGHASADGVWYPDLNGDRATVYVDEVRDGEITMGLELTADDGDLGILAPLGPAEARRLARVLEETAAIAERQRRE